MWFLDPIPFVPRTVLRFSFLAIYIVLWCSSNNKPVSFLLHIQSAEYFERTLHISWMDSATLTQSTVPAYYNFLWRPMPKFWKFELPLHFIIVWRLDCSKWVRHLESSLLWKKRTPGGTGFFNCRQHETKSSILMSRWGKYCSRTDFEEVFMQLIGLSLEWLPSLSLCAETCALLHLISPRSSHSLFCRKDISFEMA